MCAMASPRGFRPRPGANGLVKTPNLCMSLARHITDSASPRAGSGDEMGPIFAQGSTIQIFCRARPAPNFNIKLQVEDRFRYQLFFYETQNKQLKFTRHVLDLSNSSISKSYDGIGVVIYFGRVPPQRNLNFPTKKNAGAVQVACIPSQYAPEGIY